MRIKKTPCGKLDYRIEWGKWLNDDDVITSSTIAPLTPNSDVTVFGENIVDGKNIDFCLEGGTLGKRYKFKNHIVCALPISGEIVREECEVFDVLIVNNI